MVKNQLLHAPNGKKMTNQNYEELSNKKSSSLKKFSFDRLEKRRRTLQVPFLGR